MTHVAMSCYRCTASLYGCTGACQWAPHTPEQQRGFAEIPAKGCICPPMAEKTCQRWDCGRKSPDMTPR